MKVEHTPYFFVHSVSTGGRGTLYWRFRVEGLHDVA